MNYSDFILSIEADWEPETGFFWKARQGIFDQSDFERLRAKLQALVVDENALLPRRLVSLLWYMPLVMSWQEDRVRDSGGDSAAYTRAINAATTEVQRILGVP
jgi:hypothetical protein